MQATFGLRVNVGYDRMMPWEKHFLYKKIILYSIYVITVMARPSRTTDNPRHGA